MLDLARELDFLGLETLFYSYVPRRRAARFGLPARCHRGLLPFMAPFVAWNAYGGSVLPNLQERALVHALNAAVTARLSRCDVFICMSGLFLEAAAYARQRFGASIWLERGSRHILSQDDILKDIAGSKRPTPFMIERELRGYELADRIVVPSSHVAESFDERAPALSRKLFINPYGVDLDQFPSRDGSPPPGPPTVLFVGSWSYQKGADVLATAIRELGNVQLLHVGAMADAPFPHDDPRFEHVGPVPQWDLFKYYAKAHVFALASRQDGFGMVLLQAAASGLPIVCSEMTGGADLKVSQALSERIFVTPAADMEQLTRAIGAAIKLATEPSGLPPLSTHDRDLLSWSSYGRRYYDELRRSVASEIRRPISTQTRFMSLRSSETP